MTLNKDTILELRELIRADFRKSDYCLGEECVERFFRTILNEEEPKDKTLPINRHDKSFTGDEIIKALASVLENNKLDPLCNRSDTFYKRLSNGK